MLPMDIQPVGHIETPYLTKFGVPRQPGLVSGATSTLILGVEFEWVFELRAGSYLWLVWDFSLNHREGAKWSKTVRPPLLGGTRRVGVFATRSSFRPNNIAISSVRVEAAYRDESGRACVLVTDADMVSGTPVFAVYPYDPATDSIDGAHGSWNDHVTWPTLERVVFVREDDGKRFSRAGSGLEQVLLQDPRPAYTRATSDERVFWLQYGEYLCRFRVVEGTVVVLRVDVMTQAQEQELMTTGTLRGEFS